MNRSDLSAFIGQHKLAVLSTTGIAGTPQSALVGIALTPRFEIIFDTVKSTRKYRNLIARPDCSFVIGWEGAQTVQYEGRAAELEPPELESRQAAYFQVWPDGPSRLAWPGIVYFIVRPSWIRYSDFSQDPPLIEEFRF